MAGMTHEEMLEQTRAFMKKLNSRPMPDAVKWEIERLEAIESGAYAKTPEAQARVARLLGKKPPQ